MPISFQNIPANWKVPLYWVEVDSSMAGLPVLALPALLAGTMTTDGDASTDVAQPIGSQEQADARFGQGSELSRMFKAYFACNFANEVWGVGLAEPPGAVAATADLVCTTVPTESGTLHLYVGADHVPVIIGPSFTEDDVATAIADAINADGILPVTADAAGSPGTAKLTAKWKGVNGNDITLSLNYYGRVGGETLPPGLVLTVPMHLTGGVGTPSFNTTIDNLGEKNYEYVAMPYTDASSLNAWDSEYGFSDTGRWGWKRQLFGHVFSAIRGDLGQLLTFSETRNSPVTSVMAFETASPSPVYEWCAAYTAKAQRGLVNDPARPLQTLSLNGIKLAPQHLRFLTSEVDTIAHHGLATQIPGSDNQPMISRETTTYQLNLYGFEDDAYELVTTLATLAKLLRNQKQAITSKFPRHKLANDGTRFGPGQAIVTPGIIKAELVAQYRMDEFNGLAENTREFKRNLLVERDPNDPNRVNVLYPPDLVNQLRLFAVLAQFRLQYDRGLDADIATGATLTAATGIMAA
jgi:phage tail sheath gpL-like